MMKIKSALLIFLFTGGILFVSCNQGNTKKPKDNITIEENHNNSKMAEHNHVMNDSRISLNLPPKKAHHQLMNMRSHLQAVQSIINYLSKNEFDSASVVATKKLGMSNEMKMMCSSFGNKEFEDLGFAFHNSADTMSEVFKTKDKDKSLEALSLTLNYCVTCHSTFKQ